MNSQRYCPTGFPPHSELSAKIDATALRRDAEEGSREEFAHASLCKKCQQWHVYVPTGKSARSIRRKRRKKVQE